MVHRIPVFIPTVDAAPLALHRAALPTRLRSQPLEGGPLEVAIATLKRTVVLQGLRTLYPLWGCERCPLRGYDRHLWPLGGLRVGCDHNPTNATLRSWVMITTQKVL